jgi:RNA polymerase sigma-70 factor (ECF subfamily)
MGDDARVVSQLVERARGGDTESFAELVRRYSRAVRSMCLLRASDPDRADDISQQVFITAWKRLKDLRPHSPWWPWLEGITRNHLRNEWRRMKRERAFRQRYTVAWLAENDPMAGNAEKVEKLEAQVENLRQCMDQLPKNLRQLVDLRYRQSNTSDRIAVVMGKTSEAVRQMLVRLRDKLRDCVKRRMVKGGLA